MFEVRFFGGLKWSTNYIQQLLPSAIPLDIVDAKTLPLAHNTHTTSQSSLYVQKFLTAATTHKTRKKAREVILSKVFRLS